MTYWWPVLVMGVTPIVTAVGAWLGRGWYDRPAQARK